MPAKLRAKKPKISKRSRFVMPMLFLAIGGLLIGLWTAKQVYSSQSLSVPTAILSPVGTEEQNNQPRYIPRTITIGNLLTLKVEEAKLAKRAWSISPTFATYLPASGVPGKTGNIILYGHNKRNIFANLRHVKTGQTIDVITTDNILHRYSVSLVTTVKPTEIQYLLATPDETLTLYTCAGLLDQNRLIVQAKPL